jgi:hypothetical protein
VAVPAQDRGRCYQQSEAATGGQQSNEGCDHRSIGPAEPRPGCAALQHRQLMPQDEDLNLVGRIGAGA